MAWGTTKLSPVIHSAAICTTGSSKEVMDEEKKSPDDEARGVKRETPQDDFDD